VARVVLPPFEMALRAGARSVMTSDTDTDGVPAADPVLLTTLLRDTLGFSGTVVSDYFAVAFLRTLHRVAETNGDAARLALQAGLDVELWVGASSGDIRSVVRLELTGSTRQVGAERVLQPTVRVEAR
jgi:beta-glucosidase